MKPEWGKKVVCAECGSVFYDMHKSDIVCVKCGFKFKSVTVKKSAEAKKKSKKSAFPENKDFDTVECYNSEDDTTSVMNGNFVMEDD